MYFLIMGAYGTHGFQVCNKLLNSGYEVFHYNVNDELLESTMFEEKQLMIGRNSNFTIIDDVNQSLLQKKIAVILPLIDWQSLQKGEKELCRKRTLNFLREIGDSTRGNVWIFIINESDEDILDFNDKIDNIKTVTLKSELTEVEKIIQLLEQDRVIPSQAIHE